MNRSNIDNFKDQLEKYDVRRKSMRMRPDLLIKLKNGIQAANRIMKKSQTKSGADKEDMQKKNESKRHSCGLVGFNNWFWYLWDVIILVLYQLELVAIAFE